MFGLIMKQSGSHELLCITQFLIRNSIGNVKKAVRKWGKPHSPGSPLHSLYLKLPKLDGEDPGRTEIIMLCDGAVISKDYLSFSYFQIMVLYRREFLPKYDLGCPFPSFLQFSYHC